jgi:hypothetical protein
MQVRKVAMDKKTYMQRILVTKSLFCAIVAVLGWLVCSRLIHLTDSTSVSLALALYLILELKLFFIYSETVRRRLLNLPALHDDPDAKQYIFSLKTHLAVVLIGSVIIQVLILVTAPRLDSSEMRYATIGVLPVFVLLYTPVLQFVNYRRLSSAVEVIEPSPCRFLTIFLPIWAISLLCTLSVLAGLYAAILLDSFAYLAVGVAVAVLLFFWELHVARRFVAGFTDTGN